MPDPIIAIIGLGYVGFPLALSFARKYQVTGYDSNYTKVAMHRQQLSFSGKENSRLLLSTDVIDIFKASVFIITVPTPVDTQKKPDLSALLTASRTVGAALKKGDLVIYESTVYPGCTEEDCVPVLEAASGLRYNEDFFCGYSPERINVGDQTHTLENIVKITSGSTPEAADKVDKLYASIIHAGTYKVSSIKVAEAAKVIENAQRDLNISFVNELALIMDRIGIDTNEVIDAAATKWNFLNFRPGLVGGHCIGVDPYYLTFKAEQLGYSPQVILSGRKVNEHMPHFVAEKLEQIFLQKGKMWDNPEILILGATFKENCDDLRNSRVLDLLESLNNKNARVTIVDPLVDMAALSLKLAVYFKSEIPPNLAFDAVILAVAHDNFRNIDFAEFKENGAIIYDIKNFIERDIVDARL